jgi:anti-sigma B factor antagonist
LIQVNGAINAYSASAVGEAIQSLIADGVKHLVIDLTSVDAIDSSGLGTLVGNARSMTSAGGSISLVGMTGRLRRMLSVTNLDGYFIIRDDVDEALKDLESQTVGAASPTEGV